MFPMNQVCNSKKLNKRLKAGISRQQRQIEYMRLQWLKSIPKVSKPSPILSHFTLAPNTATHSPPTISVRREEEGLCEISCEIRSHPATFMLFSTSQ